MKETTKTIPTFKDENEEREFGKRMIHWIISMSQK